MYPYHNYVFLFNLHQFCNILSFVIEQVNFVSQNNLNPYYRPLAHQNSEWVRSPQGLYFLYRKIPLFDSESVIEHQKANFEHAHEFLPYLYGSLGSEGFLSNLVFWTQKGAILKWDNFCLETYRGQTTTNKQQNKTTNNI